MSCCGARPSRRARHAGPRPGFRLRLRVCATHSMRTCARQDEWCASLTCPAARSWQMCLDAATKGAAPGCKDLQVRASACREACNASRRLMASGAHHPASFCPVPVWVSDDLCAHRCWCSEMDVQVQRTSAWGYFCRCCMPREASATCTQVRSSNVRSLSLSCTPLILRCSWRAMSLAFAARADLCVRALCLTRERAQCSFGSSRIFGGGRCQLPCTWRSSRCRYDFFNGIKPSY